MTYIDDQFKKIVPYNTKYAAVIKILSGKGNTHWMDISLKQLEQIKKVLNKGKSNNE